MGAMRSEAVLLRPARADDARAIAALALLAGGGIPEVAWAGQAEPGETLLDVGERRMRRDEGTFSYRTVTIAEVAGAIVGMMLAYPLGETTKEAIAEAETYPDFVRPLVLLELEAPHSVYINMLAVAPERQGQGIGSLLLRHAEAMARRAGCPEVSLEVFSDNARAEALYRRQGYVRRAERATVPHPGCRYGDRVFLLVRAVPPA
ncbi:GNAT family N-acetyltransferase [Marinivivus vitaminiproducens]|uniref:GNAT family N-acetyltransferase n=1 Tax=Marinivivus vitaminiproducens TaxID=3035935 RepID=UPI0027A0FBEB|nr:GNAT family N-acetyltransferase [Geminicoccaceae bacterium SCSIO 64248]